MGVNWMRDMAAIWISSILFVLILNAAADYDENVCERLKRSDGLIPPPLPTNFEMKGERVDHLHNYTVYEEMYFDYSNWRAKYMYLQRSVEHHFLFDYETAQVVQWDILHPGVNIKRDPLSHVCTATEMVDSPYRNLFGYMDGYNLRPKMYNSNQALRYGGQYEYAFNGTKRLDERGLLTNKFIGCLYDFSMDATISSLFHFTNEKVEPSGATLAEDVTGFQDGYLSVPAKTNQAGVMPDDKGKMEPFNKTLSISWFKGEPEFEVGVFQIPPWIYCNNYRGRKDMPKFPTAFSTRITMTKFQVDPLGDLGATESQSYQEIFYYAEKNLARRDFTPNPFVDTEITSKFESVSPISTIYDFNQGLRYTINKPSGRCFIEPIYQYDFFDTPKDLLFRKLATPEEIFMMETDEMEYKGKAFARDIECDVWTGRYKDERFNATFVKETYFSTNGWHEDADEMVEYGVPVKHMVIMDEVLAAEGIASFNFLKFKAKPPKLVLFDINNCVELISHQQYAIILNLDDDKRNLLYKYRFHFLETAQFYLAETSQVMTPLRIQRLQLRQKNPTGSDVLTFLLFTLLDKADLRSIPEIVGQKGADLKKAVLNLQKLVDTGTFNIQFHPPGSDEVTQVNANPGDMYIVTATGNLTLAPLPISRNFRKEIAEVEDRPVIQYEEEEENVEVEEQKGMTPGHLALLSFGMLFIGLGIGIAVMYLYARLYSERRVEERISLQLSESNSYAEDASKSSP